MLIKLYHIGHHPPINPKPKVVHGSGQIRFGVDPQPTRLNQVFKKWTCNRSNIQVGPGSSGHPLSRSEVSSDFEFEEHRRNQTQTQRTQLTTTNPKLGNQITPKIPQTQI